MFYEVITHNNQRVIELTSRSEGGMELCRNRHEVLFKQDQQQKLFALW